MDHKLHMLTKLLLIQRSIQSIRKVFPDAGQCFPQMGSSHNQLTVIMIAPNVPTVFLKRNSNLNLSLIKRSVIALLPLSFYAIQVHRQVVVCTAMLLKIIRNSISKREYLTRRFPRILKGAGDTGIQKSQCLQLHGEEVPGNPNLRKHLLIQLETNFCFVCQGAR